MTVLVTSHKNGVDGKACVVGKESNTKSLTRSIRTIALIMITITTRAIAVTLTDKVGDIIVF